MKRTKRRLSRSFPSLTIAMDMYNVGVDMAGMFATSAQVISRRSTMMADAMQGKTPLCQQEFSRMWQEKIEANLLAWKTMMGLLTAPSAPTLKDVRKLIKPYHTRSKANAKRLGKRQ